MGTTRHTSRAARNPSSAHHAAGGARCRAECPLLQPAASRVAQCARSLPLLQEYQRDCRRQDLFAIAHIAQSLVEPQFALATTAREKFEGACARKLRLDMPH